MKDIIIIINIHLISLPLRKCHCPQWQAIMAKKVLQNIRCINKLTLRFSFNLK